MITIWSPPTVSLLCLDALTQSSKAWCVCRRIWVTLGVAWIVWVLVCFGCLVSTLFKHFFFLCNIFFVHFCASDSFTNETLGINSKIFNYFHSVSYKSSHTKIKYSGKTFWVPELKHTQIQGLDPTKGPYIHRVSWKWAVKVCEIRPSDIFLPLTWQSST